MKVPYTVAILLFTTIIYSQYNYGLVVEQQDVKIQGKLNLDSGNDNVFIGTNSGISNTIGSANSFIGFGSGVSNTTGIDNSFVGWASGVSNTVGNFNNFMGQASGFQNTTGSSNSFYGQGSGLDNTTGSFSSFLGHSSGFSNTSGNSNSFIGAQAGFHNKTGDNNIAIGKGAGPSQANTTQSNRLYIDINTSVPTGGNDNPLIYGEFDNDLIRINGTLHITETAKLTPLTGPPSTCSSSAEYGTIYYDSSVSPNRIKICTDIGWTNMN